MPGMDGLKAAACIMPPAETLMTDPRAFLTELFHAAVAAAHPAACLPQLLPEPPKGRLIVLAAGKAAGSMCEVAEAHYSGVKVEGLAVARHVYGRSLKRIEMIEAGHPVPDEAG